MSASEFYNIVSGIGDSYTAGLDRYKKKNEEDQAALALTNYFDAANNPQPQGLAALGQVASPQQPMGPGAPQAPQGLAALGKIMTPPPAIKAIIDRNVPEADRPYYYQLAGKESSFNPAAVSPTGASGLLQFTRGTGRDYGLVGPNGDRRADPDANIQAGVQLTEANRAGLTQALGRAPTYSELAMAHQQGLQGAISLITGKGNIPANNLRVNNIDPSAPRDQQAAKVAGFYGFGDQGQPASPQALPGGATAYAPTAPAGQQVLGSVDVSPGSTPGSIQWGQGGPSAQRPPPAGIPAPPQSLAALGAQIPGAQPSQAAPAPQQMAQAAPAQQQRFTPEVSQALRAMVANPQTRGQAMAIIQQPKLQYQTDAEGNIIALDPNGRQAPQVVYRAAVKPTAAYGVIGEDQFGNKQYGWTDPRTQQVTPSNAPAPAVAPVAGGGVAPADGLPPAPPGVDPKVWRTEQTKQLAAGDKYTEQQSKDALFADRIRETEPVLSDPAVVAAMMNPVDIGKSKVPGVGNKLVSTEFQKGDQAARNLINAILRKESGAAISESEFQNARQQYLPQYGDTPEKLALKAQNRATVLTGLIRGSGPSYNKAQQAKPSGGPPKAGAVEDGYRFKGGNPSDPNAWVKVN